LNDASPKVPVLAPLGTDAEVLAALIAGGGLRAQVCADSRDLGAALSDGGEPGDGALFCVIAEEGAGEATGAVLRRQADEEPVWSGLPVVFLARSAAQPPPAYRMLQDCARTPPAVLLERPVSPDMLETVFRTQAEARARQFEIRDLLDSLADAERRKGFLLDELRHRTRNSLSVLQGLFLLTARRHDDLDSFVQTFSGRIRSLADAHGALAHQEGQIRDLKDLVQEHVRPYCPDPGQLRLAGPAVSLKERAALDTAMVVHELATNAGKHGALSVPEGRVTVAWSPEQGSGALDISWTEDGGPPVAPPQRRGLGTELIERLAFGGAAESRLDYRPPGLIWRARLPAEAYELAAPSDG
jgi:two-component sensor histidine kinase